MLGVVCIAATTYVLLSLGLALMVPFGSFGVENGREFQHAAYSTSFLKWAGECHGGIALLPIYLGYRKDVSRENTTRQAGPAE